MYSVNTMGFKGGIGQITHCDDLVSCEMLKARNCRGRNQSDIRGWYDYFGQKCCDKCWEIIKNSEDVVDRRFTESEQALT